MCFVLITQIKENTASTAHDQKSASSTNKCPPFFVNNPSFWYSPTRFSKKFVLPSKDIDSMKSKGFCDPYTCVEANGSKRAMSTIVHVRNCIPLQIQALRAVCPPRILCIVPSSHSSYRSISRVAHPSKTPGKNIH